ncbi:hypothetical protein C812_03562 [Paenibacillus barengoltzii G22]|uniref:Uncharacterized protein n=1 Tax=Paenibacillus barengoltzii G22 TaxID=1235795 RepID=R9LF13_9BACL|nr:hypothetical protein C812_03562 [Paenibacillus barengoltzii G22]
MNRKYMLYVISKGHCLHLQERVRARLQFWYAGQAI